MHLFQLQEIKKVPADNDTDDEFKNCVAFSTCKSGINVFIDEANHIYTAMSMYNLTEYSDNYSDTSGRLQQFKRNEVLNNNADLTADNSQSFKYKVALLGKTADAVNNTNISLKKTKIIVRLKHLSNSWRLLEMLLINCKIHLELKADSQVRDNFRQLKAL